MNEHNDHLALADQQHLADQRADKLIALGADRGVARGIAAMELGLVSSDRIDLDDREGRGDALSLLMKDEPGSGSSTRLKRQTPMESD